MTIRSPYQDVRIPNVPLVPYVLQHAERLADKTALVCGATGRSLTYGALAKAVQRAGVGLHARGVRKGDVVGIVSPNVPEFAVAFLAVASIGAICSTVNPIATAEEIGTQFADSEAMVILTIPAMLEKCQAASRLASTVREIYTFGDADGATPFARLLDYGDELPDLWIDVSRDVVALPYSSGTSGIPKGVMLTHRNLVANLAQMRASGQMLAEDDVVLGVLPFFHIYGMVVIMGGALLAGATIVTLPRFEMESFLSTMQQHRVTYANVVPPIVLALAKSPLVAAYDLGALRTVFSGAAPLGADLASACAERLCVRVRQGYGLTETSPVTHFHPIEGDDVHYASVGPLVPNTEARIVDTEGRDVPAGERGELMIRGPQVMKGYYNKPAATAACLDKDGWFRTGDVAVVDERGWFSIVDRVKELIKYKGLQVAPAELEAVLLSHPAVADVAVIPVPDEEAGEVPKAYVVTRGEATAEELMAYVAERVSPYKRVRQVEFADSIPKSPSGKILRRLLVEQERARAAGTASVPAP